MKWAVYVIHHKDSKVGRDLFVGHFENSVVDSQASSRGTQKKERGRFQTAQAYGRDRPRKMENCGARRCEVKRSGNGVGKSDLRIFRRGPKRVGPSEVRGRISFRELKGNFFCLRFTG